MVQINFAQKQINAKIVYYGPGMSGKTTNLEVIHQRAPSQNRGDLTSISTDGDRTLFFDYMPLDLGTVAGMRTCFQMYTVPGQVYYNSTRKLVLQGVDGVIFVADSSEAMLQQNIESLRNLEENLAEYGKSLATLPHVIQYNKRDLPDAMSVEELQRHMNELGVPSFEAVANTGQGVFPTLKALAASVLKNLSQEGSLSSTSHGARVPHVTTQAAPRQPAAAPPAAPADPHAPHPHAADPAAHNPAAPPAYPQQQPAAPLPQQQTAVHPAAAAMPPMPAGPTGPVAVPLPETGVVPRAAAVPPPSQMPPQAPMPAAHHPGAEAHAAPMHPQGAVPGTMTATGFHAQQQAPQQPAQATATAARPARPKARPAAGATQRAQPARNVHRRLPSTESDESAKGKGNLVYTGAFIVLATAVGAVLARAILSVL